MAEAKKQLLTLREECGKILDQICLVVGIDYDDFFRHLAEKVGNDSCSRHTRTYLKRVPEKFILGQFSVFASAIDCAVKSCGVDETIINRKEIIENWNEYREGFLAQLGKVNRSARDIVYSHRYFPK